MYFISPDFNPWCRCSLSRHLYKDCVRMQQHIKPEYNKIPALETVKRKSAFKSVSQSTRMTYAHINP